METDILAVTARLRSALRAAGGYRRVAVISGVPLGTIDNMVGGTSVRFAAVAAVARACNVSLDWIATGRNDPRSLAIDLDKVTNEIIQADCRDQIFHILEDAIGQPSALPPMPPSVAADQHAVANAGDRAVVQPQAATARADEIETHYVLTLPLDMQRALLRSISEMALSEEDEKVGPFIRGFIRAATFSEGR